MERPREARGRTRPAVRTRGLTTVDDAAAAYAAALACAPSVGDHLRIPASQGFGAGVNEAWNHVQRALALDPDFAPALAARANILLRAGFVDDAAALYERAATLDPADAAVRFALGELAHLRGDERASQRWFDDAFARRRFFSPPAAHPEARAALVLGLAGPWPRNTPLDFVVDERAWTLHRWFLPDPTPPPPAPVDLVIVALGESDAGRAAIAQATSVVAALGRPIINDPARLHALRRATLGATLAGVPRVHVPPARRVTHAALQQLDGLDGVAFPLLVRPLDSHGGRGLERLAAPADVGAYLQRVAAPAYDVTAFVDYRNRDGWYRKYRIMFVDGVPYPYHLGIDEHWMIHYYRTPTASTPWMHAEEAAFLSDPSRTFAGWDTVVPAIGAALGCDYVGIDCALLDDGTVLVFEADTAMLVHALDRSPAGRSAREAVDRIRAALAALFARRAQPLPRAPGS